MDQKYGMIVGNQFIITQKLQNELFNPGSIILRIDQQLSGETTNTTTHIRPTATNQVPTLRLAAPDEKKAIWNQFVERAAVPHRVKASDGGIYTVRQYSPLAVNKLIQIVKTPGVEYDRLIASTKQYYATVSYKVLLSNYLLKDIWKDEYDNYKPGVKIKVNDGSNPWED